MTKLSFWDNNIHAPPDTPSTSHPGRRSALSPQNKSRDFATKAQTRKPHIRPHFGIISVLSLFRSNSCYLLGPFVANTMLIKSSNNSRGGYFDLFPFFS